MPAFLRRLWNRLRRTLAPAPAIDAQLWLQTLGRYPFLARLPLHDQAKLRALAARFLQGKQFHGAHGLQVTDAMAVEIAAQACLPLLHWGTPERALAWYDDFVGIVLHPEAAVAQREVTDPAGIVHRYAEVLAGEAMHHGPVMLSWPSVAQGAHSSDAGTNVVIHEFAHKIDMRNGAPNGRPPLPAGFMGAASARAAHALWADTWSAAFAQFCEQVALAERFGAERPWLDAYAAKAPEEFFAVACEAYFVNRPRFAHAFPTLAPLLDAFFRTPPKKL